MDSKTEEPSYYAIIPSPVRYDNRLKANEKLMYGEITCLSNKLGYCFATNKYFAQLYDVNSRNIQRWIKSLSEFGYIDIEIEYIEGTKEISKRYIRLSKNFPKVKETSPPHDKNVTTPHDKNVTTPHDENVTLINTSLNNTRNNNYLINEKSFSEYVKEERGEINKPTLEEVEQHIMVNNLMVNPNEFFNKCDSYNWLMMGNPMDWKQQIYKWHQRNQPAPVAYKQMNQEQKKLEDERSSFNARKKVDRHSRQKEFFDFFSYNGANIERIQEILKFSDKPISKKDKELLLSTKEKIQQYSDVVTDEMFISILDFHRDNRNGVYTPMVKNIRGMIDSVNF